jgi:hypothetical protein
MGYVGAGVAGLIIGIALGAAGGSDLSASSANPTVTTTVHATASSDSPAAASTPEPAPFHASSKDFKLGVKTLSKECFGSAGCNITFRIDPQYIGSGTLPTEGTVEVTYQVKGGEDPLVNTFTIENGSASFESEEMISTTSSKARLTAVVTDVSYSP